MAEYVQALTKTPPTSAEDHSEAPVGKTKSLQLAMDYDKFLQACTIQKQPSLVQGGPRQHFNMPMTKQERRYMQDERTRKAWMPQLPLPRVVDRTSLQNRDFGFTQYSYQHKDVLSIYEGSVLSELAESVKLPVGQQKNTWLANQFVKIYKELSMVSSLILQSGCCTEESCPKMRAQSHNYLWQDYEGGEQKALSAPHYIKLVLANAQAMLNDARLFPKESGEKFPEKFEQILCPMFRRFFRVYAHFYRHHLDNLEAMGEGVEVRTRFCFCHCWFFIREFSLVPDVEIDTVRPLVEQWAKEVGFSVAKKNEQ